MVCNLSKNEKLWLASGSRVCWQHSQHAALKLQTITLLYVEMWNHIRGNIQLDLVYTTRAHRAHTLCACTLQTPYKGTEVLLQCRSRR